MAYSFIRAGVFPTVAFTGWRHLNSTLIFFLMTGTLRHLTEDLLNFWIFLQKTVA